MSRCLTAVGVACVLLSSAPTQAQGPSTGEAVPPNAKNAPIKSERPIPTAHAPVFRPTGLDLKAGVGYAFTNSGMPSMGRLNLTGADAAAIADLSLFFGVTADFSYVRAVNVFGTNHSADVSSYLAGPILYPFARGRMRVYVHGLAGGARVTGATPSSGGPPVTGFVNKFSWAVGGGVEYQISSSVALRSGGDYQHTYFFNPGDAIRGQRDFRAVCSIVFSVWQHPKRRY
jgi:opacity protein-like surface antigen